MRVGSGLAVLVQYLGTGRPWPGVLVVARAFVSTAMTGLVEPALGREGCENMSAVGDHLLPQ